MAKQLDLKSLYKGFTKEELLSLCAELEIKDMDLDQTSRAMVDQIVKNIDEAGLPEPADCSDLLFEFLVTAEYIDENGNEVSQEEVTQPEPKAITTQEDASKDKVLPTCYGFHDTKDPACHRCKVAKDCQVLRVKNRPQCFGKMFDKNAVECQKCIEALACQQEIQITRE